LCDGSNGTPDLRNRFVTGAGDKAPGATNSVTSFKTDMQGGHTHTVGGHTLTEAQIPSHNHTFTGAAATVTSGGQSQDHTHTIPGRLLNAPGGSPDYGFDGSSQASAVDSPQTLTTSVDHTHNVTITPAGTIAAKGGSESHTHTLDNATGHQHTITTADVREVVPYYALAYIMKL
jgi:microcystin-dependent protein